jgi:hypothetical protein
VAPGSIFLFTTIMLSLLPLMLVGAGLLWIALRSRERLAAEFAERDEPFVIAGAAPATGDPGGVAPRAAGPLAGGKA